MKTLADIKRRARVGAVLALSYAPGTRLAEKGDPPARRVVKQQTNAIAFEANEWSRGNLSWLWWPKARDVVSGGDTFSILDRGEPALTYRRCDMPADWRSRFNRWSNASPLMRPRPQVMWSRSPTMGVAFATWEPVRQELVAARDRLGGWEPIAEAMGLTVSTVKKYASGRDHRVSEAKAAQFRAAIRTALDNAAAAELLAA